MTVVPARVADPAEVTLRALGEWVGTIVVEAPVTVLKGVVLAIGKFAADLSTGKSPAEALVGVAKLLQASLVAPVPGRADAGNLFPRGGAVTQVIAATEKLRQQVMAAWSGGATAAQLAAAEAASAAATLAAEQAVAEAAAAQDKAAQAAEQATAARAAAQAAAAADDKASAQARAAEARLPTR